MPDTRFKLLSYINDALSQREAAAYVRYGGKFSRDAAYTWMLLRQLKDDVESLIPGLRPEGDKTDNITMVPLNTTHNGRKLLQSECMAWQQCCCMEPW